MVVNIIDIALARVPLAPDYLWPYGLGVLALILGGVLGFKAGGGWLSWAISCAVGALVLATIASGLANATAVPYTQRVTSKHQWIACAVVVALVALFGVADLFLVVLSAKLAAY